LFEGVLSGDDISAWLMRSATADQASGVDNQSVIDRTEACSIGQELLECGLLTVVCSGYRDDDTDRVDHLLTLDDNIVESVYSNGSDEHFSDMAGFIYRFPGKSGCAGSWTLFGAPIQIKIPTMTEETETRSTTRDTTRISLLETALGDGAEPDGAAHTHIKYVIDLAHGGDNWQCTRRYLVT
jgi:hypothetical protein